MNMLPFGAVTGLFIGLELGLFFISCIILIKIPVEKLARLCNALFGFKHLPSDTDGTTLIDVCGDRYELSTKLSTRVPFAVMFSMCFMVIAVIFIDGCVFSPKYIFPGQLCQEQFPYCYLFQSRFSLHYSPDQLVCQPNEPVLNSNTSLTRALCYGFLLPSQSTVDILNQLGVCSGILAIIKVLYPLGYRFGRRRIGGICLVGLSSGIVLLEIGLTLMQHSLSIMTLVLLNMMAFLLLTIVYIHWKRRKTRKSRLSTLVTDLNKF